MSRTQPRSPAAGASGAATDRHTWVGAGLIAGLLFGSGFCALVYQTVWLREFRLIFGASTSASAAVLAVFMAGLGLGSLMLGRRAERQARPLGYYGRLELFIALAAAATPWLIPLVRHLYLSTGGSLALGMPAATGLRLGLTGLVLLGPTFAMGGTLPAAARAAVRAADAQRRGLALLYALNTLGAVAGALAATFYLLERFGNRQTLWLACVLNAVIAMAAVVLARSMPALGAPVLPAGSTAGQVVSEEGMVKATGRASGAWSSAARPWLICGCAAMSGFAFLLMELVWYRMLNPLLGGSVFTFGLILAVALLGIGGGGALYLSRNWESAVSMPGLALTFGVEALCLAVPFALGDGIAGLALALRRWAELGFYANALGWMLIASIVVLAPSVVAGFQFPLMIALLGRGAERVGMQVGVAYAWNTAGSILGSLAGGFGLLPLLGAPGTWRLVVLLLGAASVALLTSDWRCRRGWPKARLAWLVPLAVTLLAFRLVQAHGPSAVWRHSGIGVGRADAVAQGTAAQRKDRAQLWKRTVLWEEEGVESNVALVAETGLAFLVNGKNDGNARSDAGTVIMGGLIGAWLHPQPETAMVIGLGTGCTAGWLGAVPSLRRVDTVELEPAVRRVAEACTAVNHGVLTNERVYQWTGDAREVLAVAPHRYDIIFSEPSNPYRAGVASLFTREFYETAARKLTEHGLFLQWLQAYEVDLATVQSAGATLARVFPYVETWSTQVADLLFVGSLHPISYDISRLRERLREEPFRTALPRVWRVTDIEGMLAHYVSNPGFSRELARNPEVESNTDDRTVMEFGFARSVGRRLPFDLRQWLTLADTRGATRPDLILGEVDWARVADRRDSLFILEGLEPMGLPGRLDAARHRAEAKARYVRRDLVGAVEAWRQQTSGPGDLMEWLLLAEGLAEAGDDQAALYIDALRAWMPAEADVVTARLRWRQHRLGDAVAALEAGFAQYRTDPWPWPILMYRALDLAQILSQEARDSQLSVRLETAIRQPFAVRMWDQVRLARRFNLALDTADPAILLGAIDAFEPHVPFRRPFLEKRLACYQVLGDPRAEAAARDLAAYRRMEAAPRP